MRVYVAFYKGSGGLYGAAVRLWTWSRFCHAELWLEDGTRFSVDAQKGVIKYRGNGVLYDVSLWEVIEVRASPGALHHLRTFLEETVGARYDWWGIFASQVFGLRRHARGKWFCSEHIWTALQRANQSGVTDPAPDGRMACGVSPKKLYKLLTEYEGDMQVSREQRTLMPVAVTVILVIGALLLAFR